MGMEFLFLHMKIFRCCRSIPETAASEEFTQKGSAWKPDIGNVIEVAEETEQTICFGILRITFAHFAQDRFGFLAQGGQLIQHGAIEHRIRVLLLREYPFVLTPAYAGPACDRVACGISAEPIITDDAA